MGMHASSARPRRVTPTPSSAAGGPSGRTIAAVVGISLAAVGLTAATLSGIAAAGVALQPRGPAVAAASPSPAATTPRLALTSTPAQRTILATLGSPVAPGWTKASVLTWTAGTPFDQPCGRPEQVDASLAGSRAYDVGGRQVMVTVAAYSAGQGAVALKGWSQRIADCGQGGSSIGVVPVAAPGAAGIVAYARAGDDRDAASMLMWRRGDVVASVSAPSANPAGLAARAAQVDAALLTAMAGGCADVTSSLADAARSPWVERAAFTGLTVPVTVAVPPSPTPEPPAGVTPVPNSFTPSPVPSISYPTRPAEPVWPLDLPAPVVSPITPERPKPVPAVTAVPSRVADPVGPGCGWAFTGQVAPTYDQAAEAATAAQRADQAEAEIVARQQQWQYDVVTYWRDVATYATQAEQFALYAASVRQVATAWDAIAAARSDYATALATYNAAVAARDDFLARQAAARSEYEIAVAQCNLAPSPTPTSSVSPDPSVSPSPSPTSTCPPVVPPILYESPPTLPPVPTPPPDPRPTPTP